MKHIPQMQNQSQVPARRRRRPFINMYKMCTPLTQTPDLIRPHNQNNATARRLPQNKLNTKRECSTCVCVFVMFV